MFKNINNTLVGIVGGMGPLASNKFLELVTENSNAKNDQDHIRLLLFSNPKIPDRSNFLLSENQENPNKEILQTIKSLKKAGATHAVLTCNTAHAPTIFKKLTQKSPIPIINMVELAVSSLKQSTSETNICILGTTGTINANVYGTYLEKSGYKAVYPNTSDQNTIMQIIYEIKQSGPLDIHNFLINQIIERVRIESKCNTFVLGCTELSLLAVNNKCISVDPLEVLSKHVIKISRQQRSPVILYCLKSSKYFFKSILHKVSSVFKQI